MPVAKSTVLSWQRNDIKIVPDQIECDLTIPQAVALPVVERLFPVGLGHDGPHAAVVARSH